MVRFLTILCLILAIAIGVVILAERIQQTLTVTLNAKEPK